MPTIASANDATKKELVDAVLGPSVFNVIHYGATGDGATDDTTAIQAAIDAAEADGGGTVYVPDGTYIVSIQASDACLNVLGSNINIHLAADSRIKLADGEVLSTGKGVIIKWGDGTTAYTGFSLTGSGTLDWNYDNNWSSAGVNASGCLYIHGPVSDVYIAPEVHFANCKSGGTTTGVGDQGGDAIFIRGQDTSNRARNIRVCGQFTDVGEACTWVYADHVHILDGWYIDGTSQDAFEPALGCNYFSVRAGLCRNLVGSLVDAFNDASNGVIGPGIVVESMDASYGAGPLFNIGPSTSGNAAGSNILITGVNARGLLAGAVVLRSTGDGITENVQVTDCEFESVSGSTVNADNGVIIPTGTKDCLLDNVTVTGPYLRSFYLLGGADAGRQTVTNCVASGAFQPGFNVGNNWTVEKNTAINCGQDTGAAATARAGFVFNGKYINVNGNTAIDDQGTKTTQNGFVFSGVGGVEGSVIVSGGNRSIGPTNPINIVPAAGSNQPVIQKDNFGMGNVDRGTLSVPAGTDNGAQVFASNITNQYALAIDDVNIVPTSELFGATSWRVSIVSGRNIRVDLTGTNTSAVTFAWSCHAKNAG